MGMPPTDPPTNSFKQRYHWFIVLLILIFEGRGLFSPVFSMIYQGQKLSAYSEREKPDKVSVFTINSLRN